MPSRWNNSILPGLEQDNEKDDGSTKCLLRQSEEDVEVAQAKRQRASVPPSDRWYTILNFAMFCFSFVVFVAQMRERFGAAYSKNSLLKQTSYYCTCSNLLKSAGLTVLLALVFDTINLKTSVVQIDGSVFDTPNPSPYRNIPFPGFFVNHQCRDFDAIVRWQEENTLPLEKGMNFTKFNDAVEIPISDLYYEIFGVDKVQIHE